MMRSMTKTLRGKIFTKFFQLGFIFAEVYSQVTTQDQTIKFPKLMSHDILITLSITAILIAIGKYFDDAEASYNQIDNTWKNRCHFMAILFNFLARLGSYVIYIMYLINAINKNAKGKSIALICLLIICNTIIIVLKCVSCYRK